MIFKIAKTGGTIDDSVQNLAFDASQNYMIILDEYHIQTDSNGNYDINHNLEYTPSFYIFSSVDNVSWTRPWQSYTVTGSHADDSKIYVRGLDPNYYAHVVIWSNSYDDSIGTINNNVVGMLKVAKDGYSADIAKDLRQFVFASGKGFIIIKEKKQLSITVNSSYYDEETEMYTWNQSVSYAHGLGYTPQVQVFLSDGSQIPFEMLYVGGLGGYSIRYTIDDTNLTIIFEGLAEYNANGISITVNSHIFFNKII